VRFHPQNLPLLLIGCSRLALTQLRLSVTHVPSRSASFSTPEEHSHVALALPGCRHVRYLEVIRRTYAHREFYRPLPDAVSCQPCREVS
jgi:hypothetical protein